MNRSIPIPVVSNDFSRYVTVRYAIVRDVRSRFPVLAGQLELLQRMSRQSELEALGLEDVVARRSRLPVFASPPAERRRRQDVPVVGFHGPRRHLARDAAAPECGRSCTANYRRSAIIVLPDDAQVRCSGSRRGFAHLAAQVGNDVITASGTTLLGADNKAGVAEILGATEYPPAAIPEIKHGVRSAWVSRRTRRSVKGADAISTSSAFGATLRPTPWMERRVGELQVETFSADAHGA